MIVVAVESLGGSETPAGKRGKEVPAVVGLWQKKGKVIVY